MTIVSTTVGKNPLEEMEQPSQSNKRVQNAVLGCNLKNDRIISVHFQGKPLSITVIQVYAPTSNAEEAEVERFYEDLQHPEKMSFSLQGTGMQKQEVKKQQLELEMEQQTSSKSGKEYVKAVYCHPACLTYMQSTA